MIFFIHHQNAIHFAKIDVDAASTVTTLAISKDPYQINASPKWQYIRHDNLPTTLAAFVPEREASVVLSICTNRTLSMISFQKILQERIPKDVSCLLNGTWQIVNREAPLSAASSYQEFSDTASLNRTYQAYVNEKNNWQQQVLPEAIFNINPEQAKLSRYQQTIVAAVFTDHLEALLAESDSKTEYVESLQAAIEGSITDEKVSNWSSATKANCLKLRLAIFPANINTFCGPAAFYSEKDDKIAKKTTIADIQRYMYSVVINEIKRHQPTLCITPPEPEASTHVLLGALSGTQQMRLYTGLSQHAQHILDLTILLITKNDSELHAFLSKKQNVIDNDLIAIHRLLHAMSSHLYHDEEQSIADELIAVLLAGGHDIEFLINRLTPQIASFRAGIQFCQAIPTNNTEASAWDGINLITTLGFRQQAVLEPCYSMSFQQLRRLEQILDVLFKDKTTQNKLLIQQLTQQHANKTTDFSYKLYAMLKKFIKSCIATHALLFSGNPPIRVQMREIRRITIVTENMTNRGRQYCTIPIFITTAAELVAFVKRHDHDIVTYVCNALFALKKNDKRSNVYKVLNNCHDLFCLLNAIPKNDHEWFVLDILLKMENLKNLMITMQDLMRIHSALNNPTLLIIIIKSLLNKNSQTNRGGEFLRPIYPESFSHLKRFVLANMQTCLTNENAIDNLITNMNGLDSNNPSSANLGALRRYCLDYFVAAFPLDTPASPISCNAFVTSGANVFNLIDNFIAKQAIKTFLFSKPETTTEPYPHLNSLASANHLSLLLIELVNSIETLCIIFRQQPPSTIEDVITYLFPYGNIYTTQSTMRFDKNHLIKSFADVEQLITALLANPFKKTNVLHLTKNNVFLDAIQTPEHYKRLFALFPLPTQKTKLFTQLHHYHNPTITRHSSFETTYRTQIHFSETKIKIHRLSPEDNFHCYRLKILQALTPNSAILFYSVNTRPIMAIKQLDNDDSTENFLRLKTIVIAHLQNLIDRRMTVAEISKDSEIISYSLLSFRLEEHEAVRAKKHLASIDNIH